jgi:hypothetical protein
MLFDLILIQYMTTAKNRTMTAIKTPQPALLAFDVVRWGRAGWNGGSGKSCWGANSPGLGVASSGPKDTFFLVERLVGLRGAVE